jgi:hypothetical protein
MDLSDVSIEQWGVVEQSSIAAIVEDSRRIIHARQALRDAAVSYLDRLTWHVRPEDQGQMIEVAWAAVGEAGVLRRRSDRSARETTYSLHPWLDVLPAGLSEDDVQWEPWNGTLGCEDEGRGLTAAAAEAIAMEVAS